MWCCAAALVFMAGMTDLALAQEPVIQVGDRLEVVVQGHPDLSGVMEVEPDGRAVMPGALIRLPAAERPFSAVEEDIVTVVESLLADPATVSVRLLPPDEQDPVEPPPDDDLPPADEEEATQRASGTASGNPLVDWIIPGGGQFAAGRTGPGILTLAVAGAGVGVAVGIRNEEQVCARPVPQGSPCPPGDILEVTEDRPFLIYGIAAAVAATVISALDAHSFVRGQAVSLSSRPVGAAGAIEFSLSIPVGSAVRGSGIR